MSLLEPIWLLLAVPLGAWLWWWSMPSRSLAVLRVLVLGFCLLGLARLVVELPSRDGTVVVVLDRSLSMPQGVDAQHQEIVELVQGAMGLEDRLAVVTFGHNVRLEHPPQIEKFSGFVQNIQPDASNLHSALDMAVNLIEPETPGRVLVISDGRWTGRDPVRVAARAAARGIAIDHRLVQRPSTRDLSIRSVEAPSRVGTKEAFMLLAWVDAPVAQEARYRLTRNGKLLTEGVQRLGSGLNRLVFRDAIEEASTVEYLLSVKGPQDDPIPENNRARILVAAEGTKPLLVVSHKDRPQLVRLLSEAGLKTKHLKPSSTKWDLTELSNYSAVWLEDVPSTHLGRVGMMNLSEWVRKTGAGLIMSGGPNSFGPGGYFQSPLEPLMPVSMELRQEHRKHSMAIAIALDRSGSMTM
ncbi:MAG: VWA domain-containing protein, partial [Phycisphaeraceae bacterium]|nr:VWA domain-containing protein [Phycisphaeraceae bacterium]